jgi:hypothetical protein
VKIVPPTKWGLVFFFLLVSLFSCLFFWASGSPKSRQHHPGHNSSSCTVVLSWLDNSWEYSSIASDYFIKFKLMSSIISIQ